MERFRGPPVLPLRHGYKQSSLESQFPWELQVECSIHPLLPTTHMLAAEVACSCGMFQCKNPSGGESSNG